MKKCILTFILLLIATVAHGTGIVGSGNFNAGGETTVIVTPIGSGTWDTTDNTNIFWWPNTTNYAATDGTPQGDWTQSAHDSGLAWAGWSCDDGDKISWELPGLAGHLNTEGTVWFSLYVSSAGWSGTDVIHIVSLRETVTACNYPGLPDYSTLGLQLMNSGDVDPIWQFLRFDCGGTAYSRDVQYFGATNSMTSGWYRVGFSWKFEDEDLYVSLSVDGNWYDDSYSTGPACTGPTEDLAFFEIGGECWTDDRTEWCDVSGEDDMAIDDLFIMGGFKDPDPSL
jgi:hypothetical protein